MTVDPKLENIAYKVLEKMEVKPKSNEHGSIILIIMIVGIILSLIRIIQECNKNKILPLDYNKKIKFFTDEIHTLSIKRTWLNQLRLGRVIKQKLSQSDYKLYGKSMKKAIMDTGINLTEDESQTLLEASNV